MFSLIAGFWKLLFDRPNLHVLIIGLDHAGKTTILEKIKAQFSNTPSLPPERIPPTVGMNLAKIQMKGSKIVFWDLGGQKKMRSIWERYYKEANAVVFVVDSADVGRLEEAKAAFETLAPSHRREYARWVAEATLPATRVRRSEAAVERIKAAVRRPQSA
jgi:ADP-ribosylation factor related protein 1